LPQSHKQCEVCQENAATVHLTEMSNQHVVKERHLCDGCAQKEGLVGKLQLNLVTELLGQLKGGPGKEKSKETDVKCPECGMTYSEFRAKARFGCAKDYEIFRKHVVALLEKIHGTTTHAGKKPKKHAPGKSAAKAEPEAPLAEMEKEMEKAIQAEEYEKAAKLRDRIRLARGRKEKPQ
jgi:protein arginine kinase activator